MICTKDAPGRQELFLSTSGNNETIPPRLASLLVLVALVVFHLSRLHSSQVLVSGHCDPSSPSSFIVYCHSRVVLFFFLIPQSL